MKSILFVDDERAVLDGLRARLHALNSKWTMKFVESGALAITEMQEHPYDVIVTDMRMPMMSGATLLEHVGANWPQTIRVVLSGYSELEMTTSLVPLAHQYLSKPCQPRQLENVIERCLLLHDLLSRPQLRAVVGRIQKLPSLPAIYAAFQSILSNQSVTNREVAALVTADAALAARVLQIVNSAFFRLARRISSVEQAVAYLGFTAIRNLAMSVEVFSKWPGGTCSVLNLGLLQLHAQGVAAAANALGAKTTFADDAMLAGLLHDIGYWVLAQECPEELGKAVALSISARIPLYAAEMEIIGASHAEIGAYLLGIWGLPLSVVEAVAHHHQPERVSHSEFDVLAAVVSAHALVPSDDATAFGRDVPPDPKIDATYLAGVNAPFDWEEAVRRVAETAE
jgi:HD-like signal output (HDOD) protein/ActR/RegA family two-component response regulator